MKLNLELLNHTFVHKPLLIGGMAMEYYGLRKAGADIDLVVHPDDHAALVKRFPDHIKDIYGDTFTGLADYGGFEFLECEYGGNEDGIFIEDVEAPGNINPEECKDFSYTRNDLYWLAKINYVECGAESVRTRIGISNTVINRVRSPIYPNNIPDAILDVKHGVQYPPSHTAKFRNAVPSRTSMVAAKCALHGVELVGTSVAFVHVNAFARSWAGNNMRHYTTIGVVGFFTFD